MYISQRKKTKLLKFKIYNTLGMKDVCVSKLESN